MKFSTLKKILSVLSIVFTGITVIYLTYLDGWRDISLGRIHRQAHDLFQDVEDVYEVRIYLIHGEGVPDGSFPIRPYERDEPTYGSVTLKGDDLAGFLEIWTAQSVDWGAQAMCHDPVYGFRLYRKWKPTEETSMCWGCSNFYVSPYPRFSAWYGFNSETEAAKELLAYCDRRLPYKK